MILIVILIIAFVLFHWIKNKKNKRLFQEKQKQNLYDLINYIKTNLNRGFSEERLRRTLISVGYSEEHIRQAFNLIRR